MNIRQQIDDYIENHTEELTGFLSELISYPSVMGEAEENAPFGRANRQVLEHFLAKCGEFGFITHNYEGYAGHADMNDLPPELGILCHLDVVPQGTGWHSDPFKAEIKDGKVFGRGAIDDKGPAAAALFAMRCLSELNAPLSKGVRIIVGCNEENGSEDMEYYTKQTDFPPLLVTPDGSYPVINIEKGMLRCEITARLPRTSLVSLKGGSVINAVPELCTAVVKGITPFDVMCCADDTDGIFFSSESVPEGLKITARGVCAHASTPEQGKNAVTAMLMLLKNLRVDTGDSIAALSKLFPYGETDGSSAGIKCSDDISGALTAVLSVLEISDDRLVGKIDCRFPVSESLEGISARLCENIEAEGILAEIIMGSEPHYVDSDSDFIRTLLDVYEEMTGNKGECIAIGGGTYVHETPNGVAFGAEFPGEDNHMHGADEFITIESLKLNAKMYANAIVRLCGTENN